MQYIILDFLALSYIDPSGVTALKLLNEDFNKVDIIIYIAGISGIILKGHNLIRLNVFVTNVCIKS
jgi:anti-anti-sigma regulatory factor